MTTFAITALVLIMMPGPDQALMTRNVLAGGRVAGLLTMTGGALGVVVHAMGAAVGLSALLMTSSEAFTALKTVGVAYLLWLGVQSIRAGRGAPPGATDAAGGSAGRSVSYLRQGFWSNALNPKVALFFVTFLPQFLPLDGTVSDSSRSQALLLSAIFALLYVGWFGSYVLAVSRVSAWLSRPTVRARIEQVTGLLLVGFAIRLAAVAH
jgi:threonine/homoserine/homoserine lactone efflux protein